MSILFPKLNKPRQWDYRPIYYDPAKEERKEKLAKLQAQRKQQEQDKNTDYVPNLHRGSFREARELNNRISDKARKGSRLAFWIALLIMLVLAFYVMI